MASSLYTSTPYTQRSDGWILTGQDPSSTSSAKYVPLAQCDNYGHLITRNYTITLTGTGTSSAFGATNFTDGVTVSVLDYGKSVTLYFPATTDTASSNNVGLFTAALPADIRPANEVLEPIWVIDNAAIAAGSILITTAGVVTLSVASATKFTNSAACGWKGFSVTYLTSL